MSEIDRLSREVKSLNAQMQDLKKQMDARCQTMQADMRSQMQEYEKKLRQKAEAQSEQMKKQYERELAALRRSFDIQLSKEEKKMTDQYLSLADELEKTRESVLRREEELEQMVKTWTDSHEKKEKQMEQQARMYLGEMEEAMKQVEEKPYETFFPGKMKVYGGTFKNAWNLMKNGLAQAAAAVAVSVRSALERFSIDIDSSQKAWETEFEEVCAYCDQLRGDLTAWEQSWTEQEGGLSSEEGSFRAEADLNYWTKGWYLPVKVWLTERLDRNQEIRKLGIMEYLKQENAVTMDGLREEGKLLRQYLELLPQYRRIYADTYENAREREEWADKISRYLVQEKSYFHDEGEDRIQQADSFLLRQEYFQLYNQRILEDEENTDDYQGWYMMEFHNDNHIRLEVCILPVASAGGLKNVVQFHIGQGEHAVSMEELLSSIKTALQTVLTGTGAAVLNTNSPGEMKQLQTHAMGRQVIKEVDGWLSQKN